MAGLMAQRSSPMLNKIRRELERRRKSINVAKGGVVKKSAAAAAAAAAPPPPRLIPSVSGAGTATLKLANAPKEGVARKFFAALPHPRVLIPGGSPGASATATKVSTPTTHPTTGAETRCIKKPSSAPIQPRSSSIGMTVKVRGPAKILSTGQRIFILHAAIVVSDVEDGYLEVMYHCNYPRRGVVQIAMDQVKTIAPLTK